ncbi:MAG TPA: hypothetical protein DCG30_00340 [Ruminococcus sp.]|nr:hypothetical protein [Ruminococcus sp.]
MKKFISMVSAAAIAVSATAAAVFTSSPAQAADDEIKIMCIGDSITDGYGIAGSYRKFLYNGLTEKGYNIDMIGSKTGWSTTYTGENGESFDYDDDNTGYSGYAVKAYSGRSGIYETLIETDCLSQNPDIVILQIGTNNIIDNHDMDENLNDLDTLVSYILENIPESSTLFVTTIPDLDPNRSDVYSWFGNYRHSADWQTQYDDETAELNVKANIVTYNERLTSYISERNQKGDNIRPANVNSAITDVKTQLADGVHPNNIGYKAMGEYWTGIIDSYLSGKSPEEQPVTETTTETATETTTTETSTVTTETTTAETSTTATETITAEITTETTTEYIPERYYYSVSDLVKLTKYVLNEKNSITAEESEAYDLIKDGQLDVFDVIIMRDEILKK